MASTAAHPRRLRLHATLLVLALLSLSHSSTAKLVPTSHPHLRHRDLVNRQVISADPSGPVAPSSAAATPTPTTAPAPTTAPTVSSAEPSTTQGRIGSFFSGISSFFDPPSTANTRSSTSSSSSSSSNTRSTNSRNTITSVSSRATLDPVLLTSVVPAPTSSAPAPSASAASSDDGSGIGLGKGTLIAVAVIASVVGGIFAIWTIIRKWKLSPSRRHQRKLADADDDIYAPRAPSFAEKRDYHNTHFRDPSHSSSPNLAGYGTHSAYPDLPPPTAAYHQDAYGAGGLGRSDSTVSGMTGGGRQFNEYPNGPPYGAAEYGALPSASSPASLHPTAAFDPSYRVPSPGFDPAYRVPSPAAPHNAYDPNFRTASPGNFDPTYRTASPAAPPQQQQQHQFDPSYRTGSPAQLAVQPPMQRAPSPGAGMGMGGIDYRVPSPAPLQQGYGYEGLTRQPTLGSGVGGYQGQPMQQQQDGGMGMAPSLPGFPDMGQQQQGRY